jgi:DNA-binding NtrC family response regulator
LDDSIRDQTYELKVESYELSVFSLLAMKLETFLRKGILKMANEAVDPTVPTAAASIASSGAPQARPALTLINSPRAISYDQYECFIGCSTNVADLKSFIGLHAPQMHPVLLIGERGLRQEQVARVLHQASAQWAQPFFAVNAHGLSSDALHNLLFGSQGVIETVKHGTIYINELTSLPLLLQQRFAVYLEENRWREQGGQATRQRLVFASEWNPSDRTAENRIAYGLVEMLRQYSFTIKPLRDRSEDLPYLARHLVTRIAQRMNRGVHEITPEALAALSSYHWEGNLDELETVLEGAINCLSPQQIDEFALPSRIRYAQLKSIPPEGVDLPQIVDDFERNLIATALEQSGGSQTKASKLLGLRVQTLNMKLKRYADQSRPLI